ncbi:MAG TPA: diphosphate--fructose-6-phosphate 1-phosphotransferase [Chloroflexota bacterium]|nr:diphosphate--fructose-6-phosphate 1-phosphotransferase [Chloroflexota bacterium]
MSMTPAAMVIAQSGGPTAVVNASLVGACAVGDASASVDRVLGARFGVEGLRDGDFVDLSALSSPNLRRLRGTPGAALGSSRHRPTDEEIASCLAVLDRHLIRWVVLIGGNDSAETLHRLHVAAVGRGSAARFVGVPKTIDNDLPHMDHAPGYGSAARYLAIAAREAGLDTCAMRRTDPIKIIEVMGRNAGWLAAASALGRERVDDPPQIIFFPERPRPVDRMLEEIRAAHAAHGWALVTISENQRDDAGAPIGGSQPIHVDPHGHEYHESAGLALVRAVQSRLGLRARYERPGSLQRTSAAMLSAVDVEEAEAAGAHAARLALRGESDVMVAIQRREGRGYAVRFGAIPLELVAHQERRMPDEYIASSGIDVTDAYVAYGRPLIGAPLDPTFRLERRGA